MFQVSNLKCKKNYFWQKEKKIIFIKFKTLIQCFMLSQIFALVYAYDY